MEHETNNPAVRAFLSTYGNQDPRAMLERLTIWQRAWEAALAQQGTAELRQAYAACLAGLPADALAQEMESLSEALPPDYYVMTAAELEHATRDPHWKTVVIDPDEFRY